MSRLMSDPRTFEEVLAQIEGIPLDQYRKEAEDVRALRERGEAFRDLPPTQWPPLQFNWDLSPPGQRFALDGIKPGEFAAAYPLGLTLGFLQLADLDAALCHFNRRNDLVELWECGFASELCAVIAYLEAGRPITPPLVAPVNGELCFHGGNHRYAAAKFSGQTQIPIYVQPEHRDAVAELIPVNWASAD